MVFLTEFTELLTIILISYSEVMRVMSIGGAEFGGVTEKISQTEISE